MFVHCINTNMLPFYAISQQHIKIQLGFVFLWQHEETCQLAAVKNFIIKYRCYILMIIIKYFPNFPKFAALTTRIYEGRRRGEVKRGQSRGPGGAGKAGRYLQKCRVDFTWTLVARARVIKVNSSGTRKIRCTTSRRKVSHFVYLSCSFWHADVVHFSGGFVSYGLFLVPMEPKMWKFSKKNWRSRTVLRSRTIRERQWRA